MKSPRLNAEFPRWLRRQVLRILEAGNEHRRPIEGGELVVSILILILTLAYAAPYFHAMATTSLWHDELHSIMHFSSKGPLTVVTDYTLTNNHVFFNLLNSLTPGSESFHPLRARLWSFIFMTAMAVLVAGYFVRRKAYLEAAVFTFVVFTNRVVLDLSLQARGYGFLFLCFAAISLLHVEFIRTARTPYFLAIALLAILAGWTLPPLFFLAGFVMLATFLNRPSVQTLTIGIFAPASLLLLYLPVLGQLNRQAQAFSEAKARYFGDVGAVFDTVQYYLLRTPEDWLILLFLSVVLAGPGLILRYCRDEQKWLPVSVQLQGVSAVAFFTVFLFLKTPYPRTASPVVMILLLAALFIFHYFYRNQCPVLIRPIIYISLFFMFVLHGLPAVRIFSFVPIEDWSGAASFIERVLPENTRVFCNFRVYNLRAYLDPNFQTDHQLDPAAFHSGRQIVIDSDFFQEPEDRFRPEPTTEALTSVEIPQRRGGFQRIFIFPPQPENEVCAVAVNGKPLASDILFDRGIEEAIALNSGGNGGAPLTLELSLAPGKKYRSVVIVGDYLSVPADGLEVRTEGKASHSDSVLQNGDSLVLLLGDQAVQTILLRLEPDPHHRPVRLREIWTYQSSDGRVTSE